MRDQEAELQRRNTKVVVVTFEAGFLAQQYVTETQLSWPLLIDESQATYQSYGMLSASFWDIWGPKTWLVYARELFKGAKLQQSAGDIYQRGGDVLIDPDGMVRLHHVGDGPADRPAVELILNMIPRGYQT